jgi:hypothetical protein
MALNCLSLTVANMCSRNAGHPDSPASHGDNSPIEQLGAVVFEDLFHQLDTPVRRYIGQADNAAGRGLIEKDESTEILIHGHQNTVFDPGSLQQHSVTGIRTALPGLHHVMTLCPQPFGQTMAGTAVDEKLHRVATVTSSSVSWAMMACA